MKLYDSNIQKPENVSVGLRGWRLEDPIGVNLLRNCKGGGGLFIAQMDLRK